MCDVWDLDEKRKKMKNIFDDKKIIFDKKNLKSQFSSAGGRPSIVSNPKFLFFFFFFLEIEFVLFFRHRKEFFRTTRFFLSWNWIKFFSRPFEIGPGILNEQKNFRRKIKVKNYFFDKKLLILNGMVLYYCCCCLSEIYLFFSHRNIFLQVQLKWRIVLVSFLHNL